MTPFRTSACLVIGGLALASAGFAAHAASPQPTPAQSLAQADGAAARPNAPGGDTAQSRNAARSRMRECGHQWSSMKKNGSAAGLTWKDFSQGCLAKQ